MNEIGDEIHFILYCEKNESLRRALYVNVRECISNFDVMNENEKIVVLMNDVRICKYVAQFIMKSFYMKTMINDVSRKPLKAVHLQVTLDE